MNNLSATPASGTRMVTALRGESQGCLKKSRKLVQYAGDRKCRKFDTVRRTFNGRCHRWHTVHGSVAGVNGNPNVPYLWSDANERNVDLNWRDDDWNANYRFLAVRHFHDFPARSPCVTRVFSFCASCRRHPPSIFPASAIISER